MDGRLIFLHCVGRLKGQDVFPKVSARLEEGVPQGRGQLRSRSGRKAGREKPMPDKGGARTKTDTGRRDEYSKALERTLVKELCKLAP